MLRALAARAIDECGATQILIGAAGDGPASKLYFRVGARPVAHSVMLAGALGRP
jgi:hypothetical protein